MPEGAVPNAFMIQGTAGRAPAYFIELQLDMYDNYKD